MKTRNFPSCIFDQKLPRNERYWWLHILDTRGLKSKKNKVLGLIWKKTSILALMYQLLFYVARFRFRKNIVGQITRVHPTSGQHSIPWYIINSAIIQLDVNSHDGTSHHHSALQRYLRRTCCFFWKLSNSKRTCRVEGILMWTPVANRDIIIATQHFFIRGIVSYLCSPIWTWRL